MSRLLLALVWLWSLALPASAAFQIFGPSPYLSSLDSPIPWAPGYKLESFEGSPGTVTGYVASAGTRLGPGALVDSVDPGGVSLYSSGSRTLVFSFDPSWSGGLPTAAGIVWTDVGYQDGELEGSGMFKGIGTVEFRAFDGSGTLIGSPLIGSGLGDGSAGGGQAEDRFFGLVNADGISRIEISMPTSGDWEVDHLQYGLAVPEPSSVFLLGSGLLLLGLTARRRVR